MSKQPKRIQVKETEMYWGDFEGPLESIVASLENLIEQGWEGLENEYVPYEDYTSPYLYLYKHREENDKEYEKRMKLLKKEDEQKLKAKEKRRQDYEKLKKEFGDD